MEYIDPCDVCGGTGTPINGKPCACGGTGKLIDTCTHLRERLFDVEKELDSLKGRLIFMGNA